MFANSAREHDSPSRRRHVTATASSAPPSLVTSPWSSPATRVRKRPPTKTSSPIRIPQASTTLGEDVFAFSNSLSPPRISDSPQIGTRARRVLRTWRSDPSTSPVKRPPRGGKAAGDARLEEEEEEDDNEISARATRAESPVIRRSMSTVSADLSLNLRRRDALVDSSFDSLLRDSVDFDVLGRASPPSRRRRHGKDASVVATTTTTKNHASRVKVALNREISVGPGDFQRHVSITREQRSFRDLKYIEPIGLARPYASFTALRLKSPEVAASVMRVLSATLHGGPRGQTVAAWPPPASSSSSSSRDASSRSFDMLTAKELIGVVNAASELVGESATLVNVRAPVKIFGDLHGQFADLLEFFRRYGAPSHRHGDVNVCNYVFNGDLVDRGAFSLEVLTVVLCLKLRYHPNVVVLRGNHEDRNLNGVYGFSAECKRRLGGDEIGEVVLDAVWRLFDLLPLAALVEDRVVCMHGGIGQHVKRLDQIRAIERPVRLVPGIVHENPVVVDLLWSDPVDTYGRHCASSSSKKKKRHRNVSTTTTTTRANRKRGVGSTFDAADVEKFCIRNDVDLVVRAHECVEPGWTVTAGGRCITVFSAPRYCNTHRNAGAILEINGRLEVMCKKILCEESTGSWVNVADATPPPSPRSSDAKDEDEEEDTKRSGLGMLSRLFIDSEKFEKDSDVSARSSSSTTTTTTTTTERGREDGGDDNDDKRDAPLLPEERREDDVRDFSPPPPPPPHSSSSSSSSSSSPNVEPVLMLAISDNRSSDPPQLVVISPRSLRRQKAKGVAPSIGRSNDCEIQVPNSCDLVSREHLQLELVDGAWHAVDVSSMGTAIRFDDDPKRSQRLQPKMPFAIRDGMQFYLGSFKDGGAVVKAKVLSPRSAQQRKRRRGRPFSAS